MRYVISDIHGCYQEYRQLLDKIHFSDDDELYVLGDVVDRGPEPIRVIQDIMLRPNVAYILGNHDYMMLKVLKKCAVKITGENYDSYLTTDDLMDYAYWMQDGGDITLQQFSQLSQEEQQAILSYIEDAFVYEMLEDKGKIYVLVHAGISNFNDEKDLDEYDFADFIFERMDYDRRYYQDEDTYIITGHTPTVRIRSDARPEIYAKNGHIAIDCGCVYGGNLAAYCIETGEAVYVSGTDVR